MFEMNFNEEFKKYLIDRIKDVGFDVSPERSNQIIETVMTFANDPYCCNSFHDERDRFNKINNKINEEINTLIEEHNKEIEERRSNETVEKKLDRIEDHLIELIKILKENK